MAIEKRSWKGGNVTYRVRLLVRGPDTGKKRNLTIGSYRTRRAAEKAERKAKDDHETGALVQPSIETVEEVLASWHRVKSLKVTTNTAMDYGMAIRLHVVPALGAHRVQKLTTRRIQEQYGQWLNGGMGARMVHRCHIVLSQALALAVRHDLIYRNPCDGVELPRIERPETEVWTSEEVGAFLTEAKDDAWSPLWFLLAMEGMRRGEALGLRWSDVNWGRNMAHVFQTVIADKQSRGAALIQPRTKTHAGARTVSLTRETMTILEVHRDRQRFQRQAVGDAWEDNDLILCTGTGRPINPNNVTRSYNQLVIISGVPRIKVHGLRHSHASLLLRSGIPLKIVSERLGHASIAITADLYAHVSESMQETAADAMSDLIYEPDTGKHPVGRVRGAHNRR